MVFSLAAESLKTARKTGGTKEIQDVLSNQLESRNG